MKDKKMLKRTSAADFTSGIPNKKNPKDSLVNKAYSLGYQQAALVNGMQAMAQQQAEQQQQYAQAVQQLFQLQAQLAQQNQAAPVVGQMPSAAPPAPSPALPGMSLPTQPTAATPAPPPMM